MKIIIENFQVLLHTAFSLYFQQESEYASLRGVSLDKSELSEITGKELTWEETIILSLAIMPHVHPQALDLFFIQNKELDRQYTEFGGWKGNSHNGFLPTGETAAFLLGIEHTDARATVIELFSRDYWFYKENILRLEGQGSGEPFLSGKLTVSEEFLAKVMGNKEYRPDYSSDFPAKRMETQLEWDDLIVPHHVNDNLESISNWIENEKEILARWNLNKYIKTGYRCLFYGPPGTGKTLAASLLGKKHNKPVYRIDLSMIVSKYIGETEKNLAKIFDFAEHRDWILFFDEADALFGKRTDSNSSNDRHANQEVAYLLQRIENFNGIVILATNLKDNIDEAFFRRFQTSINFPLPDEASKIEFCIRIFPKDWFIDNNYRNQLFSMITETKLSMGAIINVVQECAIQLINATYEILDKELLDKAIKRELKKEGLIL